jgi:hypothetical protein
MQDGTIAEIERWLRERARESRRQDAEASATDSNNASQDRPAQDQDRPYWPYLESDDFWRQ